MTHLKIGDVSFDADLVVFDKDGTLVNFGLMWNRIAVAWVEGVTSGADNGALQLELYRTLGYDPQHQQTNPDSPMAMAEIDQLQTITAAVLYRHGVPWTQAEDRARRAFRQVSHDLPLADLVRPLGDVSRLLTSLHEANVRVAIVTTDHRLETEETLRILGIAQLVDHLVCGDDGLAWKPAPDALLDTCRDLGVNPAHTVVIGDTLADLLMAERANVGLKVGVLTGVGVQEQLRVHADVVLPSIDRIVAR